uniref:Coiled-coil domain-containing protein 28B-like isoform X2 n=1 Tax=Saccoglossus kowalevskii TaxID=10224 RepID=A0ABM0MNC5_SACKO|nr:PREDICTED: coiled-coil domain-containing protein 28B-like isoform X2 [Saccoglossus kowalevskii]
MTDMWNANEKTRYARLSGADSLGAHSAGSSQSQASTVIAAERGRKSSGMSSSQDKERTLTTKGRPCKEHVFLTDVADVRQMEQGLLQMLNDFHSGRLQAFGKECSFGHMDNVRDLQEKLSRLHFDLDNQQQTHGLGSDEAKEAANEHMEQLLLNLEQLSSAIQSLHPNEGNPSGSAAH